MRRSPGAGRRECGRALRGSVFLSCAVLVGTLAVGGHSLGSSPAESADESAAFDQLLRLLAERRHDHVTFTEVQELAILDQPLHSSGELLYDAPDRLEKRTLEPRVEDLVLEHGMLSVQRDHHRRSVALLEEGCRGDPYNWFNFYDFWQAPTHGADA